MLNKTLKFEDIITFTRNSAATYWDSNGVMQTAAAGEPRFDHDPVTGEALGILIEEQRTNIDPLSSLFNWTESNSSGVAPDSRFAENGVAQGPDGTMSAARVTASTDLDLQRMYKSLSATGAFIHSVWMKADSSDFGVIKFTTGGTLVVDLTDGAIVISPATQAHGVEPGPDGWFRLWIENFDDNSVCQILLYDGANTNFAGNGESIFVWGHQLEEGAFPTSYVPTNGAAATRAKDGATLSPSPWFDGATGTMLVAFRSDDPVDSAYHGLFGVGSGIGARLGLYSQRPAAKEAVFHSGGTGIVPLGEAPEEVAHAVAASFDSQTGQVVASLDGGTAVTDTGFNEVENATIARIGASYLPSEYSKRTWISAIQFFPYTMTGEELEEKMA